MDVDIKTGTIFYKTKQAFEDGNKIVIHRGGTGSGKTYDIVLFLFFIALKFKDLIITIVSESRPHLDIGAIRILEGICKKIGLWTKDNWNITTARWTAPTGSIIEFFSADRIDKALGARRDWLFGNEINSLKKDVWDELARRSENVIGDFNPTSQFWLEDWLMNYNDTIVIKSNYLDNPFLPETEKNRIATRAKRDKNFKRIHIDCEYGISEGVIFSNWQQIDAMPDGDGVYGLDFGFSNDPTALVKVIETEDAFFVDELIYRTGLLNKDIIKMMEQLGIRKDYDEIIADSAEPKSIQEIHDAGFNIKPAKKGADSVRVGIDKLQSKNIFVTKRSVNLIKELRNYCWLEDKDGKPTNKPIDAYNHCFVGETLIKTNTGFKRIDEINIGDKVLTSSGYKRVNNVFYNGCREVLHLSLNFGIFVVDIIGTSTHKIKTTKGWKQLKDLTTGDELFLLNLQGLKDNTSTVKFITNIQENVITQKEQHDYIELYGNTITEKFLKDTMFTILMKTQKIIISKISNVLKALNILVYMLKKDFQQKMEWIMRLKGWIMQEYSQTNGMVHQKVLSGIKNIGKIQLVKCNKLKWNVSNADQNIMQSITGTIDFVQTNASQNGEEMQDLTILLNDANYAEKNLKAINIQKQDFVVKNAPQSIELKSSKILNVYTDNVYDLSVDDVHEYFANGILVHNCCDALRYAVIPKYNFKFSVK